MLSFPWDRMNWTSSSFFALPVTNAVELALHQGREVLISAGRIVRKKGKGNPFLGAKIKEVRDTSNQ